MYFNPYPKDTNWRSQEYFDWLKEQVPLIAGEGDTVPHHLRCLGGGGIGIKPPDDHCIPISDSVHQKIHSSGRNGGERNVLLKQHGYTIEMLADICATYRRIWEREQKTNNGAHLKRHAAANMGR